MLINRVHPYLFRKLYISAAAVLEHQPKLEAVICHSKYFDSLHLKLSFQIIGIVNDYRSLAPVLREIGGGQHCTVVAH